MLPVCPDKVNPVEFVPVHTVAPPAMLPPTEVGDTVTVNTLLYTVPSFVVVAALLKYVVCVNDDGLYVADVALAMFENPVVVDVVDDCH